MNYQRILQFKGTWRNYQARVLNRADQYLQDGKIHIVAAPGSGKTTLGIELIARMGEPALILAPSITIREQWVARIEEAFLCDGIRTEDYISQNLKDPRVITVVTYQALHAAMTRYEGVLNETGTGDDVLADDAPGGEGGIGEESDCTEQRTAADSSGVQQKTAAGKLPESGTEEVDYTGFDLIGTVKEAGFGVLCLDECHHLRSEWWKALEEFKKEVENLKVIALTATPPYDSTPAMWTRYMDMCGNIDEEITIPELVKEGSLCPHQDYVYFNYPTKEETGEIEKYKTRSEEVTGQLMQDQQFLRAVQSHGSLNGTIPEDELLDEPSYLAAILIFLQEKGEPFPSRLQKLLGAKKLPAMEPKWMEKLLQGFLYDDADSFYCDQVYREQVMELLKQNGLIEKRKVCLSVNKALEKLLTTSKGKCESIEKIVTHEYQSMGSALRLLVLTDYIRKEYEKTVGDENADVTALGVLPFFEQLRRARIVCEKGAEAGKRLRLGVLCGTMVIIPAEAKEALLEAVGDNGKVTFGTVGLLPETDYLKVNAVGDAHFLTAAVTEVFSQGYIQALIGTKSLLGEGWDSPCINSLILASFVGSFMLSNQMRGRAIRVFKKEPEKTSNIWHLVCVNPKKQTKEGEADEYSEDFRLLIRRMEHFLGLHYTEDTIESGIDRMSVITPPFDKRNVEKINREMLRMSGERDLLRDRWNRSLVVFDQMEVAEETVTNERFITAASFYDALRQAVISAVCSILCTLVYASGLAGPFGLASAIMGLAAFMVCIAKFPKIFTLGTPLKRWKCLGDGIRKALMEKGLMESENSKVMAELLSAVDYAIFLSGGSGRDKALFAQCVCEFLSPVDNQRYLLVKEKHHGGNDGFYCVPEAFAKKKEDAEAFQKCMAPYMGKYELVYTRNAKGRELLLEGRVKALANRQERFLSRRKVKGALE